MTSRLALRARRATVGCVAAVALSLTACTGGGGGLGGDGNVNTIDAGVAEGIGSAVESAMAQSQSTQAIVGVWDENGEYVQGFGDVNGGARFRGGQTTQPMICALLLDAVDRGRVELDEKVQDQLPRLTGLGDVTYEQLCTMRSGIADFTGAYVDINANNPARFWSEQELIAQGFAHSPLPWPGLDYYYSDTNAVILGRALHVEAGQNLQDVLRDHVLDPADMSDSYYPTMNTLTIPGDAMSALNYPSSGGVPVCEVGTVAPEEVSPSMLQAAGGTVTTAADLKRFYDYYFSSDFGGEGANKLVTTAVSTTNPERDANGEPVAEVPEPEPGETLQAFGTEKIGPLYGMSGAITGTISAAYHDPESGYTVVVALNNSSAGRGFAKILALQIAAISGLDVPWTADDMSAQLSEAAICQSADEEPSDEEAAEEEAAE